MLDLQTLQYFSDLGVSVAKDDDKDKPNHWYVIPDKPSWHTRPDPQRPSKIAVDFSFVKVTTTGQVTTAGQGDRAFFSFTTQLAAEEKVLAEVRKKSDALASATFLSPWFTHTNAGLSVYANPPSGKQGQPAPDEGTTFVKAVTHLLSPQRFGPALCPFQVELGKYGSAVMEALLTEAEDSGLQVGYELKQLVRLPPAKIYAKIEADILMDATVKWASGKSRGVWGESKSDEKATTPDSFDATIKQQLRPSIQIEWVANPYQDAATAAKVRTNIENWIFKLLEEQLKKIPGVDELMKSLQGTRPDGRKIEELKKKFELVSKDKPLFEVNYSSRDAVEYTWIASGSLPGIGRVIPEVRTAGDDRRRYFLEVTANDPFFAQRQVVVSFTDNLTKITGAKIEGTLSMQKMPDAGVVDWDKKQVTENFKFDEAGGFSPVRVKMPLREGADAKYREVTLDVYLRGTVAGSPVSLHRRKTLTEGDADRVDLNFASLGLHQRTLDPSLLTFGTTARDLRRAIVYCRYRTAAGADAWSRTFEFKPSGTTPPASQEFQFSIPADESGGALQYRVEYVYGDGQYPAEAKRTWRRFETDTLLIPSFFRSEAVEVLAQDFKAGSKDQLQVTLVYEGESLADRVTLYLDADNPKKTATLRRVPDEQGKLLVTSVLVRKPAGGQVTLLDEAEFPLGTVNLSTQPTFPVSLDLSLVNDAVWKQIEELAVNVQLTKGYEKQPKLKFTVTKQGQAVKPRQFPFGNADDVEIKWDADFMMLDGSTRRQSKSGETLSDVSEGITIRPSFARAKPFEG